MYPRKLKSMSSAMIEDQKSKACPRLRSGVKSKEKSFTLIEVVVVMGIMGLIVGGLIASLRQIVDGETLLKKMQAVEEESRFIMDAFAQDAEYSELSDAYKPDTDSIYSEILKFKLTEKKSDLSTDSTLESKYEYYPPRNSSVHNYFLKRTFIDTATDPATTTSVTLNNTPLNDPPGFRVKLIESPDGAENYLVTMSLIYRVDNKGQLIYIPIETSAMSRTFEF